MFGGKMLVIVFLGILIAFTAFALFISIKNDFSSELESMLYTTIGAIGVALYFIINSFVVSPTKEVKLSVSVPIMYHLRSGGLFSPYRKSMASLPDESLMFKGLEKYNRELYFDVFEDMQFQEKLILASTNDLSNSSTERLSYLEYVFLSWLEQEVNWLKINEKIQVTHNGYGGGMGFTNSTPSVSIELDKISNPNPFFVKMPTKLTLPSGAKMERFVNNGNISIEVATNTGSYIIRFFDGSGGIFESNGHSILLQNMARVAGGWFKDGIIPDMLWAHYPTIDIEYKPFKHTRFSDQAKRELDWLKKIDVSSYRDFSWDLLREYYSFGYHASLELYRNYNASVNVKE